MDFYFVLVLLAVLFLFARWFLGVGYGAPYLPVRRQDVTDGVELAHVTADDVVVDLGSGDGRLLVAAAQRGARVIGYEINPLLVTWSRFCLRRFKDRAQVFRKNLLEADLQDATVVFSFQLTPMMPKIDAMLTDAVRQMGRPLRVVSFAFEFPNRQPVAEQRIAKLYVF